MITAFLLLLLPAIYSSRVVPNSEEDDSLISSMDSDIVHTRHPRFVLELLKIGWSLLPVKLIAQAIVDMAKSGSVSALKMVAVGIAEVVGKEVGKEVLNGTIGEIG